MFSLLNIRVGFYLALRQLRRASRYTTVLIVFVMLLTFLNLVVVTGLLVGIIAGISNQFRIQQTGDVMITALDTKEYIENSPQVLSFLEALPQPRAITARYSAAGTVEANYFSRVDLSEKPNETGASIVGIDPLAEDNFSNLSGRVREGAYLSPSDYDAVLLGSQFVDRYSFGRQPGLTPLKNVYPGTKIRLTIKGHTREVVVKGILNVPANSPLAARIFMPAAELRQIIGRTDYAVNEIAILLAPGTDEVEFRDLLKRSGIGGKADVHTF